MTSSRRPGRLNGVGAWLLTVLAAVGVLLLGAETASAAALPDGQTRVRVSAPEMITAVGVSEHIAAGQGRGPPLSQRQIVVATGVAANTARAGEDLLGPLTRAEDEGLHKALSDPNKMHHLFGKAQHGFDPLVNKFGSQEGVVEQMYRGLQGEVPGAGRFTVERTIGGETVHIDGASVDGVPRISTAWVVP